MRRVLTIILITAVTAVDSANAADSAISGRDGRSPQEESNNPIQKKLDVQNWPNMTGVPRTTDVSLGENAKMTAQPTERDRIQRFYRDVLGCRITIKPKIDLIRLGSNYYIGIEYDDSALSESDLSRSIWLGLRTDLQEELKQKILKFGIKEINYRDKQHFYFQAPGGQIFRLVGSTEDMSQWQR